MKKSFKQLEVETRPHRIRANRIFGRAFKSYFDELEHREVPDEFYHYVARHRSFAPDDPGAKGGLCKVITGNCLGAQGPWCPYRTRGERLAFQPGSDTGT
jgi:hypothetical protein